MAFRDVPPARWYCRFLEKRLLPLIRTRITGPFPLTLSGSVFALAVPPAFWLHPLLGVGVMAVSGILDSLDGMLARAQGRASAFGAFLDSTVDRVSDFFYLTGFWVLFVKNGASAVPAAFLVYLAFLMSVLISYAKARIEGLGGRCSAGLMDRGLRTVYLLVWGAALGLWPSPAPGLLWGGLAFFLVLNTLTVVQRVLCARSILR